MEVREREKMPWNCKKAADRPGVGLLVNISAPPGNSCTPTKSYDLSKP